MATRTAVFSVSWQHADDVSTWRPLRVKFASADRAASYACRALDSLPGVARIQVTGPRGVVLKTYSRSAVSA